jgi:hypothetical protein
MLVSFLLLALLTTSLESATARLVSWTLGGGAIGGAGLVVIELAASNCELGPACTSHSYEAAITVGLIAAAIGALPLTLIAATMNRRHLEAPARAQQIAGGLIIVVSALLAVLASVRDLSATTCVVAPLLALGVAAMVRAHRRNRGLAELMGDLAADRHERLFIGAAPSEAIHDPALGVVRADADCDDAERVIMTRPRAGAGYRGAPEIPVVLARVVS